MRWLLRPLVAIGSIATAVGAVVALLLHLDAFWTRCANQPPFPCALDMLIHKTSPQVPKTQPSADPVGTVSEQTKAEITQYIEWEYLRDKEQYAETVDYYDLGQITQEAVLKEQKEEVRRFPIRHNTLDPGSVLIVLNPPDRYTVTFAFKFSKAPNSSATAIAGNSRVRVILRRVNERFLVLSVKEVAERNRSR
jgi:hypothetical protein